MSAASNFGPSEDEDIRVVSQTVERVADTMADLSTQLERATRRIGDVQSSRANEAQLGQVLLQAQQFSDGSMAESQERARLVVAQANAEAIRILEDARRQAAAIVAASQKQALPPEVIAELTTAIDTFALNSRELLNELAALRVAIAPSSTN